MVKKSLFAVAVATALLGASILPAMAQTTPDGSTTGTPPPADTTTTPPAPIAPTVMPPVTPPTNTLACVAAAVDKRETAQQAAFNTKDTSEKASLVARQAALKTAWAITDKQARKKAIIAAWDTFRTAWKTAEKQYDREVKAANKQLKADKKTCGGNESIEEPGFDKENEHMGKGSEWKGQEMKKIDNGKHKGNDKGKKGEND